MKIQNSPKYKKLLQRMGFAFNKWIFVDSWSVNCKNIIDFPAVYCVFANDILIYVGQSSWPSFRFRQHRFEENVGGKFKTPWGEFEDVYVKIKYPKKYGMEAMIEKRLIKRLKPIFNKHTYKGRKNKPVFL